jgi:hypothetical protein
MATQIEVLILNDSHLISSEHDRVRVIDTSDYDDSQKVDLIADSLIDGLRVIVLRADNDSAVKDYVESVGNGVYYVDSIKALEGYIQDALACRPWYE